MREQRTFDDLVEFFKKWPDNRQTITVLSQRPETTHDEKEILEVMIFVMDQVRPRDIS